MNDLTMLAVTKLLAKDLGDFKAPEGVHEIDETLTIHVKATVKKSPDGLFTPTVEIPLLATMALILEKAGFMRETAKALLIDAMTEALVDASNSSDRVVERVKDIEEAMKHVQAVTAALPKKIRSGPTKVEGEVEVEVVELEPV